MRENQKMNIPSGEQVLLYPFETMRITQSMNGNVSHMGTNNIDEGGERWMLAPCDVEVVNIPGFAENGIFFWSVNPVYTNDGDITHVSLFCMHMEDISSYYVGQRFSQGERMYLGGDAGFSQGKHVHYEITKGHTLHRYRPVEFGCLSRFGIDVRPDSLYSCNDTDITSTGTDGVPFIPRYYNAITTHTVSFNSNGGSSVNSQIIEDGEQATRPQEPTRDGYRFVGWFIDSQLTILYNFAAPVTSNITLYAGWVKIGDDNDIMVLYFMKIIEGGYA